MTRRRDPEKFRALIEDVEFIASTGGGFEECAQRVGKTPGALEMLLRITGHIDLTHRLRANQPTLNHSTRRSAS